MCIVDDGQGMQSQAEFGQGLNNLKTRATALGGSLSVGENSTGGVELVVKVPQDPRPQDAVHELYDREQQQD